MCPNPSFKAPARVLIPLGVLRETAGQTPSASSSPSAEGPQRGRRAINVPSWADFVPWLGHRATGGRGRVRKLPSGRWQARVLVNGKHVSLGSFAQKADANAALRTSLAAQDAGTWVDPREGRVAFGTYASEWVAGRYDLAMRTRQDYEDLLRLYPPGRRGDEGTPRAGGRPWPRRLGLPADKSADGTRPFHAEAFGRHWRRALAAVEGLPPGLVFHDLRHTGNTLAAGTGASTRELMARMGHASPRAALIYQHASAERDRAIAEALAAQIKARAAFAAVTS